MPLLPVGRVSLAVCMVAGALMALGACGRRGPLEAPPDAAAPLQPSKVAPPGGKAKASSARTRKETSSAGQESEAEPKDSDQDTAEDDTEEDQQQQTAVIVPTPKARKSGRAYTIPKEPFILDPLL